MRPNGNRGRTELQARLRVEGGDHVAELGSLTDWLRDEPELRGRVEPVIEPIGPNDMSGGVVELLTVTLGSGGIAAVLARSLNTWLKSRRPTVHLEVTVNDRKVKLAAHNVDSRQVDETLEILRDLLADPGATDT
jgi:Effector Associated Constant Component 1